ncbi:MAG: tRNA pseudouridine(38-40) synthase TruA [Dokdonella sp.]
MRIALGIEYDGTDFFGWQRLSQGRSVQGDVEAALSFVADHPIQVTCAGRTDAGVHARCQVVHFDSNAPRTERAWVHGANSRLAADVALLWAQPVADGFHARFGARTRRYRYLIQNRPIRAALHGRFVTWERVPLDVEAMHGAAQGLLGEHDFTSFRTLACQAKSPIRTIRSIAIMRAGDEISIEIEANAFLHHMVRNIVGSLLPIGRGERTSQWLAEVLQARDRSIAGPTAPATGLTFVAPRYPSEWNLTSEVTL